MTPPWIYELQVTQGILKGRHFRISEPVVILGRSPHANIAFVGDRHSSREHAHVILIGNATYIEDCGSMNGTWVNGRRIDRRTPLKPGDQIRIGENILSVRLPSSGLDIIRDSKPVIPDHRLELRRSLREESHPVTVSKPLAVSLTFKVAIAFLCVTSTLGVGIVLSPKSNADSVQTQSVSVAETIQNQEWAAQQVRTMPESVRRIHEKYESFKSDHQWGKAFSTAVWALAWNPDHLALQFAVSESARQLKNPENIGYRRDSVQSILRLAQSSYHNFDPIRVPLILTQAIIDFNLTDGLANTAELSEKCLKLNSLSRLEMNHQLMPKLSHMDSLVKEGRSDEAKEYLSHLMHEYPADRRVQLYWSHFQPLSDLSDTERALAGRASNAKK